MAAKYDDGINKIISMLEGLASKNEKLMSELEEERKVNKDLQNKVNTLLEKMEEQQKEARQQRNEDRKQLKAQEKEIQDLRKQVKRLSNQLSEKETVNAEELQRMVNEAKKSWRQNVTEIQFNENMGTFDKILHSFIQLPTWAKVTIVVGGIAICAVTVVALIQTRPGIALLALLTSASPVAAGAIKLVATGAKVEPAV